MKILTSIDENPRQKISFVSDTQQRINFLLWFEPTQNMWFFNVDTEGFSLKGQAISTNPNILEKYHNIINFGLFCTTKDGLDPYRVDDFSTGYAILGVLNENEVKELESYYEAE